MKLRHPMFRKAAAAAISWAMRPVSSSLGYRFRSLTSLDVEPRLDNRNGPFLLAFWHRDIAIMTARYAGPQCRPLISESNDGRLIDEVGRHLRMKSVLGSSTRGAVKAVRQMLAQKGRANLVITPDGPKGPPGEVKPGVVFLASRSGLPIVPCGFGYQRSWRLRTWDRLIIPFPGTRVVGIGGVPIHVPADADRDELEHFRLQVQAGLDEVSTIAQRLAA